jgi:hypothetical protein
LVKKGGTTMVKKKKPQKKRLGDRREIERRNQRRRLKKEPAKKNRRAPAARRTLNRRASVRRAGDTYSGKVKEFKALIKPVEILPPLEEEVITDDSEIVAGFETSASEDAPDPTNPVPESENN